MRTENKLYKNQGIHVINTIFTVDNGIFKVLLVKRRNEPYKGSWALVGGALYNNETLVDGTLREIKEKSGLKNVNLYQFGVFDEMGKTPTINMRMIAVTYLGLVDSKKANIIKENRNTVDADWFDINKVPHLAFGHDEILKEGIEKLRELVTLSNILKVLFPLEFTMPELQKAYESIFNKSFDRRNFRKKLISLNIIEDTNKYENRSGKKPAKLYKFKDKVEVKKVL